MNADNKGAQFGSDGAFGKLAIDGGEPVRKDHFGPRWLIGKEEREQIDDVMSKAHYAWRAGKKIQEFCKAFAAVYDMRHAIPTTSGTGAVHTAIGALNFNPYDEIITTPVTDVGSVLGILQHNLIPVFVDWDPSRFNMSAKDIESKITERTRAILVVHLFGNPCDMAAIMDIARRYNLLVIEDCAQALLAEVDGQKVGTFGEMACFSFGLKTMSTDQGGMVLTNNNDHAVRAREFVGKGTHWDGTSSIRCGQLGAFYPMTDLQAAIGVAQLTKLEDATKVRERTAAIWDDAIAGMEGFKIPQRRANERAVHYVYPFGMDPETTGVATADYVKALNAEGIGDACGPYLEGVPLSRRPLFSEARTYGDSGLPIRDESGMLRCDYRACRLPVIDSMLPNLGFLHLRNSLSESDSDDVARAMQKVANHYRRRRSTVHMNGSVKIPVEPSFESLTTLGQHAAASANGSQPRQATQERAPAAPRPTVSQSSALNVLDFGAIGDGLASSAKRNDDAFADLLRQLRQTGGRVEVPRGTYCLQNPLLLDGVRNLHLIGDGAMLGQDCATRLVYIGDGASGLLDQVTAVQCTFEGISFESRSSKAEQIVRIRAREDGPTAMSTHSVEFLHCGFRTQEKAIAPDAAGVAMRDAAHVNFRHCWFQTDCPAVEIGAAPRSDQQTISNGQCNNISFEHCMFFADVNGRHGSGFSFNNCQFSRKPNGAGARIDMTPVGDASVKNVTVIGCSAMDTDTAAGARSGFFFRQGENGVGLTMLSNRIHFYDVAILLDGKGAALVSGNVFRQTTQGAVDVCVTPNAIDTSINANDHSGTRDAGNEGAINCDLQTLMQRLPAVPHPPEVRRPSVAEPAEPAPTWSASTTDGAISFNRVSADRHFKSLSTWQWRYQHGSAQQSYWMALFDIAIPADGKAFAAEIVLTSNCPMRLNASLGRHGELTYEGKHVDVHLEADKPQRISLPRRFEHPHKALKVQLAIEELEGTDEAVLTVNSLSLDVGV